MDFDFKAHIEDKPIEGFQSNILVLIIGLLGMFIFPNIVAIAIGMFLPQDFDLVFWSYIAQLVGYGLYVAILFLFIGKDRIINILKGFISGRNIKTAIIFALFAYFGSMFINMIVTMLFGAPDSNANQDSLNSSFLTHPGLVVLLAVIFAPIVEELVFRYSIFRPLAKKNKVLAYIITMLGFAGIHFVSSVSVLLMELDDPATSSTAMTTFLEDLKTLPVYLVGAFVLTLAYDVNGNIATSILTHAFYNASQVLLMFISMYLLEDLTNSSSVIESFTNLFEYIKLLI